MQPSYDVHLGERRCDLAEVSTRAKCRTALRAVNRSAVYLRAVYLRAVYLRAVYLHAVYLHAT